MQRSPTDMYGVALLGVRLGFAQHLTGDRGGVTRAEVDVADEVHERVSFRPAEVAVWPLAPREYERDSKCHPQGQDHYRVYPDDCSGVYARILA